MSLKMKLTSAIIMFMLAIATLVIGVLAAQTQSIKMEGTINFEISDRSLYVKNVRLEDSDGTITEISSFMPGYINDGITLSLGTHTISNTSFKIHFDIINTTEELYAATETTVSSPLSPSAVTASTSGIIQAGTGTDLNSDGYFDITPESEINGTLTLTVIALQGSQVDLSGITITIEEYNLLQDAVSFTSVASTAEPQPYPTVSYNLGLEEGAWYTITFTINGEEFVKNQQCFAGDVPNNIGVAGALTLSDMSATNGCQFTLSDGKWGILLIMQNAVLDVDAQDLVYAENTTSFMVQVMTSADSGVMVSTDVVIKSIIPTI